MPAASAGYVARISVSLTTVKLAQEATVAGVDADGETLARPLAWDSNETPPTIYLIPPKDGAAPGPGDRLLARLEKHGESYEARVIRRLERETQTRLIGVLRDAQRVGVSIERSRA